MASYKRFISYVYEYENAQKSVNRGFMKVESRNGICQMMFSLRGLCRDGNGSVKIYGFRRDRSGLSLSLLSTQEVFGGILNLHLQFSDMDIGEKHFALEELSGILFACSQHICYITQWDDDALDVQQLFAGTELKKESDPPVWEEEASSPEESDAQDEPQELPNEIPEESSQHFSEKPSRKSSKEHPQEPRQESSPEPSQESSVELSRESSVELSRESSVEFSQESSVQPSQEEPKQTPDLQATSAKCACEEEKLPCFKDGSIINCVKITSRDLKKLHPQDLHLCNNRFVHYGQQIFGHLLIGQLAETGQTVLCVPGTYHQQECFMANMFGFPYFTLCSIEKSSRCCFGYWYRLIHPTNLNKRNGSS